MVHLGFALDQDLTHQHLECLCQRRVWYVALVLVELACGEKPARRNQHLMQLVHYRRFADTGIPGYQYELGGSLRHHPVERRKQSIDLALPSVQLLGYQQSVRRVVRHPEGMDRCDHATAIPTGIAEDRLPDPRRSDSAPPHFWRGAS